MELTRDEREILEAIPSTEPADFNEFCAAIGDLRPAKGEKKEWAMIFNFLDRAERAGLVTLEKDAGKTVSFVLTSEGKDLVRSFR